MPQVVIAPQIRYKWNTLYIPASLRLTKRQLAAIVKLVRYIQGGDDPEVVIESAQ